jgi:hypothetical protein
MRSRCCVCVSVYPPIYFWMPEPIFMKLGTYITAPEPISTVKSNKKFWEELIAYFPWYDTGHIENESSNKSSIVACVYSLPR